MLLFIICKHMFQFGIGVYQYQIDIKLFGAVKKFNCSSLPTTEAHVRRQRGDNSKRRVLSCTYTEIFK